MANPKLVLPHPIPEASLRKLLTELHLPVPTTISQTNTIAEYHRTYLVGFPPNAALQLLSTCPQKPYDCVSLSVRVSGRYLPHRKTSNEVAAMAWVRSHTDIIVPAVVRYEATENNAIGHEFTLLEKVPGVSVDTVHDDLSDAQRWYLIAQLLEYLQDFRRHEWHHAGGLMLNANGEVVLDWDFYAVLPLPLWIPGGGFSWNGQSTPEGIAERDRLYQMFQEVCEELADSC